MSTPRCATDAHHGANRETERSIGIIPNLIRSTYKSGLEVCKIIGRSLVSDGEAQENRKSASRVTMHEDREACLTKTSIYKLSGSEDMPGAWKQSMESLTIGMEYLGIAEKGDGLEGEGAGHDNNEDSVEVTRTDAKIHDGEAAMIAGGNKPVAHDDVDKFETTSLEAASPDRLPLVSANAPTVLVQFHPFPRLAPEIRLKIWKLAASHQRVIAFEVGKQPGPTDATSRVNQTSIHMLRINPRCSVPPLLLVNQECMQECRKVYQVREVKFSTNTFLFNPLADIVYVNGTSNYYARLDFWDLLGDIPRVAIDLCNPPADRLGRQILITCFLRTLHGQWSP
ncbi:hypothetical protein VTL71DRAFT_4465 [Oculimacula yallundae]|uniref:2EXR domain-containing protein n=1 Tax=Oculimacula yallundae TaxID=86028 RepID=A0ABR4C214_9HELO